MLKKIILSTLLLIVFGNVCHSQTKNNLEDINLVWSKFYQAFDKLDHTLMAEIHSKDLVRISGGQRISDYNTYIKRYKSNFAISKEKEVTNNISLRFFERINNDSVASERGVYRLIRNKGKDDEKAYYGQFHVIFKKEHGEWKILMDYDSTEGNTIDEKDYQAASDINDFTSFIKE